MIFLKTSDGVQVAADFYGVAAPIRYLILLHMMPATKESWHLFAEKMQREGCASLAIDFRGHGQSEGGSQGYRDFTDRDHQRSIHDVEAAVNFLKEQGATPDRIIFVGASIGANLALKYLALHPEFTSAILLSPGLNYRGIEAEPLIKKLRKDRRIMIVSARDDDRSGGHNAEMAEILAAAAPKGTSITLVVYKSGGHGTDLLSHERDGDLLGRIAAFIKP